MKKRIFITGASGFIGSNLNEQFKNKYTLFSPTHEQLELLDEERVKKYIKRNKIDIIIHCVNTGGARDESDLKNSLNINLKIFFNIVKNSHLVEKIINFGSGAEYDKSRNIINVKEEDFDKRMPKDDYGLYKYVCSKYIKNAENIVSLRPFGVYGKYENYKIRFISNSILKNLFKIPITISQNVFFSYLYVDDLVKIVDFFVQNKSRHRIYNVTPDKKIDLISAAKIINKLSEQKSKLNIINKGLNYEYSGSNKRLRKEVRINFTPFEQAVSNLIDYYRRILGKISKKEIIEDKYIKYCKTKKKWYHNQQ